MTYVYIATIISLAIYAFAATRMAQKLMESEEAAVERAIKFEAEAFELRQSMTQRRQKLAEAGRKGALVTNAKRKAAR